MTVEERLAKLEQIVGNWDVPPVLATGGTPVPLPNGRYDLKESDYQLHFALDELKRDLPKGMSIVDYVHSALDKPLDSIGGPVNPPQE